MMAFRQVPAVVILTAMVYFPSGVADSLTDPTRPYSYSVQPISGYDTVEQVSWRLTGIKIEADRRSAILNGKVVREGDLLDGGRVVEINPGGIILMHEQKRLAIRLLIPDVKNPASGVSKK